MTAPRPPADLDRRSPDLVIWTPSGAFAETFLRQPGRRFIPDDLLAAKAYAQLRATRPLRLVKLSGPGLAKLGATAQVTHGGLPYDVPQATRA